MLNALLGVDTRNLISCGLQLPSCIPHGRDRAFVVTLYAWVTRHTVTEMKLRTVTVHVVFTNQAPHAGELHLNMNAEHTQLLMCI